MSEGFSAPGTEAPAAIPAAMSAAILAARPQRRAGQQPTAAVVLIEIEVKGLE